MEVEELVPVVLMPELMLVGVVEAIASTIDDDEEEEERNGGGCWIFWAKGLKR